MHSVVEDTVGSTRSSWLFAVKYCTLHLLYEKFNALYLKVIAKVAEASLGNQEEICK